MPQIVLVIDQWRRWTEYVHQLCLCKCFCHSWMTKKKPKDPSHLKKPFIVLKNFLFFKVWCEEIFFLSFYFFIVSVYILPKWTESWLFFPQPDLVICCVRSWLFRCLYHAKLLLSSVKGCLRLSKPCRRSHLIFKVRSELPLLGSKFQVSISNSRKCEDRCRL